MRKDPKPIIEIKGLTKRYEELIAVDHLNLEIYEGEIFGLLGPNGAGKTTTILMMLGLSEPDEGAVLIQGYNATTEPIKVKEIVGYLQDNIGFYEDMTAIENLQLIARLNGKERMDQKYFDRVLERVGLYEVRHNKVGTFSRGMRQRLGIADILVKGSKVVILDEPTLGLDPEGIEGMLEIIDKLAKEDGRTVLISSHLLYQIQKVCHRVGIFVKGKMLACGPIHSLGEQVFGKENYEIELEVAPLDEVLKRKLEMMGTIIEMNENRLRIQSKEDIRENILHFLYENHYSLLKLQLISHDLEDIYKKYFERKEADDALSRS